MIRRLFGVAVLSLSFVMIGATGALACGGLVAPGHGETLQKATTLAAWHNGLEHYVTGFKFAGTAHNFGYIVPLPGVPSKIQKGGDWTLERLEIEVSPARELGFAALASADRAASHVAVIQKVKIDALDITVVRGGGRDVAAWAAENGFDLTADTPDVLGQYSSKGAIFALAKFDRVAVEQKGLIEGQGTVIHFTVPTPAPWIPLRILALGKSATEVVDADLFVLTDQIPSFDPGLDEMPGMTVRAAERASSSLLADLRSDRGMGWMPTSGMWLTALQLHTPAGTIHQDLSINGGGPESPGGGANPGALTWTWWLTAAMAAAAGGAAWALWRRGRPVARPA
jgi:uncharacterized protein DUF2330